MKNVIVSIVILLLIIAGLIVEYFQDKKRGETTMDMIGLSWMVAFLLAFFLVLALVLPKAYGHDNEHPELNHWYQSLHSNNGGLCCDGSEAVHLADPDWQTQDKPTSHYRVYLDNQWIDVPDSAVVTTPNADGRALVWPFQGYMGTNIRCFMPGVLT